MKRVYIVDDSREIRERLIGLVADADNVRVVGEASSAEVASEALDALRPDTLLLDIRLPGASGIDLLKELKRRRPGLQVIIMTNYDYPLYRRQSLQAGADLFFNKTREFEALIDELKRS